MYVICITKAVNALLPGALWHTSAQWDILPLFHVIQNVFYFPATLEHLAPESRNLKTRKKWPQKCQFFVRF